MPASQATPLSPPPAAAARASKTPPLPPSPSSPSSSSYVHQVGSRQGTRTRSRTHRNVSSSASASHRTPKYTNQDHPMAPHNLAARGYHSFRCLGVPFNVKKRYTFVRELGIGAYGCVALCHDDVLGCNVAIKKVTRIFEKDVLARRALREVAILRHIGLCDNLTALLDFDTAFIDFSEIYLCLSASEADLSQIIRSRQSLSDAHLQYFLTQLLRGVRYMHAAKIIHRDLKPGNLLVNADCALRICDFGLARAYSDSLPYTASATHDEPAPSQRTNTHTSHDASHSHNLSNLNAQHPQHPQHPSPTRSHSPVSGLHLQLNKSNIKDKQKKLNYPGGPLTGYVATRWYRTPEVMLCFREGYGPEIDMWSVGCILAELIAGSPIFPGKDYVDQITRINNILGSPSEDLIDKIGSERAKIYIKSLPNMPAVPLRNLYPNANPEALDLVAKLLTWDPDQRLTADEALQHPWLKAYHESNSHWQIPQPFDKFEQVEFIRSLLEFKGSLQREADELRGELEAFEREENGELDDQPLEDSNINGNVNGYLVDDYHGRSDNNNNNSSSSSSSNIAETHACYEATKTVKNNSDADTDTVADGNIADSGNGARADDAIDGQQSEDGARRVDADASAPATMKLEDEGHQDDLFCNASTQSGHVPADTASSSSSVNTPSSTSGASADEAEPASPRLFEACRMTTTPNVMPESKMLQKPSSVFRLGHEEEGRLRSDLTTVDQAQDGVFMPTQVLTVARGLVDYQMRGSAATAKTLAETCLLPTTHATKADYAISDHVVDSVFNAGDGAIGSATASSSSLHMSSQRRQTGARGGQASTPSLSQGLLDDATIVPTDDLLSTARKNISLHRHAKQLIVLQDSLVQSSVSLMRELIARCAARRHPVLLVSTLRRPSIYLDGNVADQTTVVDALRLGDRYGPGETESLQTVQELSAKVCEEIAKLGQNAKLTVLIDSLDTLARISHDDGLHESTWLVREVLSQIGGFSRLIVGVRAGDDPSMCGRLLASLHSPLIWGLHGSWAGSVLTAQLHSPALMRSLIKNYGLKPPSTSAAVWKALNTQLADKGLLSIPAPDDMAEGADARFWDVLRNVANRGPLGIASYEAGGGANGWWLSESCQLESLSVPTGHSEGGLRQEKEEQQRSFAPNVGGAGSAGSAGSAGVITLSDVLDTAKKGYAMLSVYYQARNGKAYEELVGLIWSSAAHMLRLLPLDMSDHREAATAPAVQGAAQGGDVDAGASRGGGDAHTKMMSALPFNLSESEEQRLRRETVPLPYAYHQHQQMHLHGNSAVRGSTGQATIFFEPEQDDDEDDEDPDDDLDV